jgi:hypothetical protein
MSAGKTEMSETGVSVVLAPEPGPDRHVRYCLPHGVAPDLPGFGKSDMPPRGEFDYTFDRLADVIDRWTEVPGLDSFALYVFDYGAPFGLDSYYLARDGADEIQLDLFIPDADVRFVDTGHFALETHVAEIAAAIGEFLAE